MWGACSWARRLKKANQISVLDPVPTVPPTHQAEIYQEGPGLGFQRDVSLQECDVRITWAKGAIGRKTYLHETLRPARWMATRSQVRDGGCTWLDAQGPADISMHWNLARRDKGRIVFPLYTCCVMEDIPCVVNWPLRSGSQRDWRKCACRCNVKRQTDENRQKCWCWHLFACDFQLRLWLFLMGRNDVHRQISL